MKTECSFRNDEQKFCRLTCTGCVDPKNCTMQIILKKIDLIEQKLKKITFW